MVMDVTGIATNDYSSGYLPTGGPDRSGDTGPGISLLLLEEKLWLNSILILLLLPVLPDVGLLCWIKNRYYG